MIEPLGDSWKSRYEMRVSVAAPTCLVLGVVALVVAACDGDPDSVATDSTANTPRSTGSLTIIAGHNASTDGEPCHRTGEGGFVTFEVKPVSLIDGASGRSAVALDWIQLPPGAYFFRLEGGDEIYGCWRQKTFFNLRPGTWSASVWGEVTGTCYNAKVVAGQNTKVRIWNNRCGGSRRRDP